MTLIEKIFEMAEEYLNKSEKEKNKKNSYLELSLKCCNKILETEPENMNANTCLGIILLKSNKEIEASEKFTKNIKKGTTNANDFFYRGFIFYNIENYEKAVEDFTKAIKLNPKLENAYYLRGASFLVLNEFEKAIFDLTESIELHSEKKTEIPENYYLRGVCYTYFNKTNKAEKDFEKTIEINPSFKKKIQEFLKELKKF